MSEGQYKPPDISCCPDEPAFVPSNSTLPQQPQPQQQPPNTTKASSSSTSTIQQQHTEEGGRLWKLAGEQVVVVELEVHSPRKKNQWTETFMARTRSCADPNASAIAANRLESSSSSSPMPRDMTQLLIVGMVGILVGWLGNAVVGTSCHFASVGQSELPFGLYKYTVDSNGSMYCSPYGGSYVHDAPLVARIMNSVALFFGTGALIVIWWNVVVVVAGSPLRQWIWTCGHRAAMIAGVFQLGTLTFYAETLCRQYTCALGPASFLSVITAVVWFGIAREMRIHPPEWVEEEEGGSEALLEMPQVILSSYEPPAIY